MPEFTGANRNGKPGATTFLELTMHASGLPRNSQADIGFAKQLETWMLTKKEVESIRAATVSEFLRSRGSVTREYPEFEYTPQDARQYSNMGYSLLGLGLARAAKLNYEDAVLNSICKPLKLNNTGLEQ